MIQKKYMYFYVHGSIMYDSQAWKQSKWLLTDKHGTYTEDMVHICNGVLLSHKKG